MHTGSMGFFHNQPFDLTVKSQTTPYPKPKVWFILCSFCCINCIILILFVCQTMTPNKFVYFKPLYSPHTGLTTCSESEFSSLSSLSMYPSTKEQGLDSFGFNTSCMCACVRACTCIRVYLALSCSLVRLSRSCSLLRELSGRIY